MIGGNCEGTDQLPENRSSDFSVFLFLRFRNKRNQALKCFLGSSFELCGRQTLPADPAGRSFGLLGSDN